MAKDPIEQCQKLEIRLKQAMIESRLVAFTPYRNANGLSSAFMFWQTATDTHILEIDYSDYESTGKYKAILAHGKRGDEPGRAVPGKLIFETEFSKKSELVECFSSWLQQTFKPPHIEQVEVNRLTP